MTTDIIEIWEQFRGVLKLYGDAFLLLNPPCSHSQIHEFEKLYNLPLPDMLQTLLGLNNGQIINQEGSKKGVFKSISGWNTYERHVFLSITEIKTAYETFIGDQVLLTEFGDREIPFAVAGAPSRYREAFCIDQLTGKVSLIWTQYVDPLNPPEWQVQKFKRGDSVTQFIEKQIELYR